MTSGGGWTTDASITDVERDSVITVITGVALNPKGRVEHQSDPQQIRPVDLLWSRRAFSVQPAVKLLATGNEKEFMPPNAWPASVALPTIGYSARLEDRALALAFPTVPEAELGRGHRLLVDVMLGVGGKKLSKVTPRQGFVRGG